jgi:hypothetical protein
MKPAALLAAAILLRFLLIGIRLRVLALLAVIALLGLWAAVARRS